MASLLPSDPPFPREIRVITSEDAMTNLPNYEPEIVSYIRKDEGFLRACATLAEILDLLPSTVEDLAFDHDFIKACARLSAAKVRLAIQFQRRQQKES